MALTIDLPIIKKTFLITSLSIICAFFACKKECVDTTEVFQVVEQQAEFPNGKEGLDKWIAANLKYPEDAKKDTIEGKVVVRFVVEIDGSATSPEVLRGVSSSLDNEAKRLVLAMPKWKPAQQRGQSVRSFFTLPIVFKL
jgi:periplasmic protein TonB